MAGGKGRDPRRPKFDVSPWLTGENKKKLIEWSRNGDSYTDIARKMGISHQTLGKYRRKTPELEDILSQGREEANNKVESALYRRCIGMSIKETTYSYRVKPDGERICTNVREVIKELPPDVQSIIFFLRCRMPETYNPDRIMQTIDPDSVGVIEVTAPDYSGTDLVEEVRKVLPALVDVCGEE